MSQYQYSSLSSGSDSIRLLRLMPHENDRSRIQCKLFDYTLHDSGKGSHLYEALSYTWGSSDKSRCSVSIGGQNLPVTENLYAALLHLQDRSLERILWIDALCINQRNLEERGQQVQLMSKIYSKAARVLIWLGETAHESDKALETIRIIAEDNSTNSLNDTATQQAVLALLERSWFQRIWVLQEVAAARQILVICGSMMVDGYTFYLGVNNFYQAYQNLERSIYPITNLIKGAIFRSKSVTTSSGRASLNICHLGELIDMFHTHKASLAVDKVYALLGMSSDDPGAADLLPDYEISWEKLFKKLIIFLFGKDISVETDHSQRAVIKSRGYILGQVSSVESDKRQNVDISFKNVASNLDDEMQWKLQASAKSIQKHDIICFLQGASKPTIIRPCRDYFTIIVAAVTPLNDIDRFRKQEFSESSTHFPRDLLLVWDWEKPLRETQDQEEYNISIKTKSQMLEYLKAEFGDHSDQATRIWNIALVFGDLKQYEIAEERLREAIEIAFGKEQLYTLESPHGLTLLSWAAGSGYDEVVSLLFAKDSIDPDLKDLKYSRTPLSWAAENGHEAVVKLLLETGKVDVNSKDSKYSRTPLWWAAESGHEAVVKLLLETGKVDIHSKDSKYNRTLLLRATENGHEAVVKLLLETGKVDIHSKDSEYSRTLLLRAAENGHKAIVKLLLERGAELEIKDNKDRTPLSWTAKNGHEAVVKLLLERGAELETKDNKGRTPLLWTAKNGHEAVVKLLLERGAELETKDNKGRTPLLRATKNGYEAVVKLLLERGAELEIKDNNYNQTPLSWAAENGHEAVVKLLLERGAELETKDSYSQTPLSWAARNGHKAVVKLLLERGAELETKDSFGQTPLSKAAMYGYEAVVKLLLERGAELETKDHNSQMPLSKAAMYGYEAVVKLLLERGAELEIKDHNSQTPLSKAAQYGNEAVVKLLLERGAELETKDNNSQTPLSKAAQYGNEAVVKLLLERGAELETKDNNGQTPLSVAARYGYKAVVKLLLERGAELETKDNNGQTPLSWAAVRGHEAVVKLLEKGSKRSQ
ncbi:hypothetical protein CJF32_00005221 [Rutstroemia sp. NJR-2017a WRK4]|nr:hypothetical protein CJF32_00005221 [Rutstroemia sp. NJR-2017a WRK4]